MKTCTKCGETKELSEFYADKSKKDEKRARCKKCDSPCQRNRRIENLEKFRAREAKMRAENPEKFRVRQSKWRAENPEKQKARDAKWRAENPEKVLSTAAKSRQNLTPSYIANVMHISVNACPPELLELKRHQLEMHRLTKQLTKEIQNGTK